MAVKTNRRVRMGFHMTPLHPASHLARRAFLKGALVTAGGAVANWGGLFHARTAAAEAAKRGKRCILLWANGGGSPIDNLDMKAGPPTPRPLPPPPPKGTRISVCEEPPP